MKKSFTTQGTCARFIDIELENGCIREVRFVGGCNGNAQGISALIRGMPVPEVVERVRGLQCRNGTSCPDQLAKALIEMVLDKAS
jgi:uncharacterized protein (TIGR03905 family)